MIKVKEISKKKELIAGDPSDWEVVGETFVYDIDPASQYIKPPTGGWYEKQYVDMFPEYFKDFRKQWNLERSEEVIELLRAEEIAYNVREQLSGIISKIKSDKLVTVEGDLSGNKYECIKKE